MHVVGEGRPARPINSGAFESSNDLPRLNTSVSARQLRAKFNRCRAIPGGWAARPKIGEFKETAPSKEGMHSIYR